MTSTAPLCELINQLIDCRDIIFTAINRQLGKEGYRLIPPSSFTIFLAYRESNEPLKMRDICTILNYYKNLSYPYRLLLDRGYIKEILIPGQDGRSCHFIFTEEGIKISRIIQSMLQEKFPHDALDIRTTLQDLKIILKSFITD